MGEAVQVGDLGPGVAAAAKPKAETSLGKLTNIQVLRAFAALFVALLHAAGAQWMMRDDKQFLAYFNGHLGSFGVALFFAISGFLMAQLVRSTTPGLFLCHRIVRIYPIFFIIVGLWFVIRPHVGAGIAFDWVSLTLAPAGNRVYPLGNVEWSLLHETIFYLGLFLISAAGLARHVELIAAGWLALLAAVSLAGADAAATTLSPNIFTILLADANAAFAGGLLVPFLVERRLLPARLCLLAIPAVAVVIAKELEPFRWTLGIPAIFIVAALVQVRQVRVRGVIGEAIVRFGDWSYVLYLVHPAAYGIVYGLAPKTMPALPMFLAAIGFALVATALLGPLDIALYRRLRVVVDRAGTERCTRRAWGFAAAYVTVGCVFGVLHLRDQADLARARASITRLPPASLADEVALADAIASGGLAVPASFAGEIDRAVRLPDGKILVVGWGIDGERPGDLVHLAIACGGTVVEVGRPQRYRADVVARLGRQDFKRRRFGFTLVIKPGTCAPNGALLPIFVDARSRLFATAPVVPSAATPADARPQAVQAAP